MSLNSAIEWTQTTWNPVTGCSKVSSGCMNCYAERIARRLKAMGQPNYAAGFRVTLHPHMLELPLRWRRPQVIFVNSMSDLFHEEVPFSFIEQVFEVMNRASWHRFQILTKRSARACGLSSKLPWSKNIWLGVTVEEQDCLYRTEDLRKTNAEVKFISFEPLLGPMAALDLRGIDWVIVGGESSPNARPMSAAWVLKIQEQCRLRGIPFFFKQWGGKRKKRAGRVLEGKTWDEMPLVG